ncbi:TolC family protein [Salidesulfovibrio onnuriiensis]|uniref:TolC family protein n=1 Tax=Salidesulfovibrio onnuriiensis TaxID=2583823 RepID=UPI00164FE856|nr:TolC family protein [Salidesulfovibrio onnuriiensis]
MFNRLILISFLILCCISLPLQVQADEADGVIVLENVLSELVQTHDRIQAAESALKSAEHMLGKAKGGWLPRVDVTAEGGHEDIDKPNADTSYNRNEQTFKVTQNVYDFGKTSGDIASYENLVNEKQARLLRTKQEIILSGIVAYLNLIKQREILYYVIKTEKSIKELSGMQEALVRKGAGLSYEELQVKGQLVGVQSRRVTAERELQKAKNNFKAVYGYFVNEDSIAKLQLPASPVALIPATLDEAIDKAVVNNPDLQELQFVVERLRGVLQKNQSAFFPEFDLVLDGKRRENDDGLSGVRWENRATMAMNYNLFSGMSDTEAVKAAKQDIISAKKQQLNQRRTVEENVRNAWVELLTLRKNVELYDNQSSITWEFLGLVKKKKAMGADVNLLDILVGERDYINSVSAKVEAEVETIIASYKLLQAMGIISVESTKS